MNPLDLLQSYLYGPEDTISHEYDSAAYRLTFDDKRQIEEVIRKHGVGALQNVTKGGAMLYLRSAMRFSGEDAAYLRSLFDPETVKWSGLGDDTSRHQPTVNLPAPENGWPIKEEKVALPYSQAPEGVALALLTKDGWSGVHTEGNTLRCLFRAILLPYLIEKNPYDRVDPVNTPLCHAIHYLIPMTAIGLEGILSNKREVPRRPIEEMHKFIDWRLHQPVYGVQDDFMKVSDAHGSVWPKTPEVGLDVLKYLSAVPSRFWHDLLEIYARFDGTLSHGWPDLELTNGREIEMVEVKVKDRLTASQKLTMPILMALGIKCRVIRLMNTKK